MAKNKKLRANIKGFADADYLDSLSEKDRAWYLQAIHGEYYSNEINRKSSIHRKNLKGKTYICSKCSASADAFDLAKKATFSATNAQNRDSYGISSVGTFLKHLDDPASHTDLTAPLKVLTKSMDPEEAYMVFMRECVGEIDSANPRDLDVILTEFAQEMVKLGSSMSRQRINTVLRKRKEKKK